MMHARINTARIEFRGRTREVPRRNFQDKNCKDVTDSFGGVKAATNTNTFRSGFSQKCGTQCWVSIKLLDN